MHKNENNSSVIKFLSQIWHSYCEKIKRHLDYSLISLILVIFFYNILLYNLKVLEISWDGAAHASNGVLLHDMIRDVIVRNHSFSPFAMYKYILNFNLEVYPSLGGSIAVWPLLIPFLFMISFFLFGISYSSAYLVVIIMGNICIIITFFIGDELFDGRVGLLASLFLAFSALFFVFSKTALLDVPIAMMFTLSIYSLIHTKKAMRVNKRKLKKQSFLTGLVVGLAFMTKNTGILILPVIILYFMITYAHKFRNRNVKEIIQRLGKILKYNLWIFYGIIPAFLLIGFQMGIYFFAGFLSAWIAVLTGAVNRVQGENQFTVQDWLFYITETGHSIPILGGILFGLAYAIFRRTKRDKFLLSWYFTVYLTLSFLRRVNKYGRYFLIAFPVMFILMARAIIEISDRLRVYRPRIVNMGAITVVALIFLSGALATLQNPYPYQYNYDASGYSKTPTSETAMEEVALFLIEEGENTMQMTLNPTISPSAMIFYILKHDREHKTRYYDVWWVTKKAELTVDEFKERMKQLKISYLLISDPGNAPTFRILDTYVNYALENPNKISLIRVFEGEYSIYIYKVLETF